MSFHYLNCSMISVFYFFRIFKIGSAETLCDIRSKCEIGDAKINESIKKLAEE